MSVDDFFTPERLMEAGVEVKGNLSRIKQAMWRHNISRKMFKHESCKTVGDVVEETRYSWVRTTHIGEKTISAMEKVLAMAGLKLYGEK